jgi:hypothetical protein
MTAQAGTSRASGASRPASERRVWLPSGGASPGAGETLAAGLVTRAIDILLP